MLRVLTVDDEPQVLRSLQRLLRNDNFVVDATTSGDKARYLLGQNDYDVVLCDLVMLPTNGLDVLDACQQLRSPPAFVMMSGHGDLARTLNGTRADFPLIEKPNFSGLGRRLRSLLRVPKPPSPVGMGIDASQLRRVARTDELVLILGETGVGKTYLAERIHRLSRRRDGPFVTVSCGELAKDLFVSQFFGHKKGTFTGAHEDYAGPVPRAEGGTLFLDEIGDLEASHQTALLTFLNDRTYARLGEADRRHADVRIIAATNVDLTQRVRDGRFRDDLLARLDVVPLPVPPLRERREDIPRLVRQMSTLIAKEHGRGPVQFSQASYKILMHYAWPKNIRELNNAIRWVSAMHDVDIHIEPSMLPPGMRPKQTPESAPSPNLDVLEAASSDRDDLPPLPPPTQLDQYTDVLQYRMMLCALGSLGNKTKAAEHLGMERTTFHERLRRYSNRYGAFRVPDSSDE